MNSLKLLLFLLFCSTLGAQVLPNWDLLEEEMKKNLDDSFSFSSLKKGQLFSEISRTSKPELHFEMMSFRDRPLLAYGGFLCVKATEPNSTAFRSMDLILNSDTPGNLLFSPVIEYLSFLKPGREFDQAFSKIVSQSVIDPRKLVFLVFSLPYEAVLEWFNDPSRDEIGATAQAVVLDALYSNRSIPVSNKMKNALDRLREVPGYGRAVFTIHSERDSASDLEIKSVLVDKSVPDDLIRILTTRKPERVGKLLDEVVLSDSRKAMVEKWLKIKTDF